MPSTLTDLDRAGRNSSDCYHVLISSLKAPPIAPSALSAPGGRAVGRRFAPPSAGGSASRCHGAPSAPHVKSPRHRDFEGGSPKTPKPRPSQHQNHEAQTIPASKPRSPNHPSTKTSKPRPSQPQNLGAQTQKLPKVAQSDRGPYGVRGFEAPRPGRGLGFEVWGLKPRFWAGGSATGSSGGG